MGGIDDESSTKLSEPLTGSGSSDGGKTTGSELEMGVNQPPSNDKVVEDLTRRVAASNIRENVTMSLVENWIKGANDTEEDEKDKFIKKFKEWVLQGARAAVDDNMSIPASHEIYPLGTESRTAYRKRLGNIVKNFGDMDLATVLRNNLVAHAGIESEEERKWRLDRMREALGNNDPLYGIGDEGDLLKTKLGEYHTAARNWKLGDGDPANTIHSAMTVVSDMALERTPEYIAFSGASGSGKTMSMLYSATEESKVAFKDTPNIFKVYIKSYDHPTSDKQADFKSKIVVEIGRKLKDELTMSEHLRDEISETPEVVRDVGLILVLDEVDYEIEHTTILGLKSAIRRKLGFKFIVIMAGSTGLNRSIMNQPSKPGELYKVQIRPVEKEAAMALLKTRLENHEDAFEELESAMPFLPNLLTNHRCAKYASDELLKLIVALTSPGMPTELIHDTFVEYGPILLFLVARRYLSVNGMAELMHYNRVRMMQYCLALASLQDVDLTEQGVSKELVDEALENKAFAVGLVELHMDGSGCDEKRRIIMSSALALVSVITIAGPCYIGAKSEFEKLEVLAAVHLSAIRFAQTCDVWQVRQLDGAVPYTGNDNERHRISQDYHENHSTVYINGAGAAYADVMAKEIPVDAGKTEKFRVLNRLALKVHNGSVLVQAKRSESGCDLTAPEVNDELYKVGMKEPEKLEEPKKPGVGATTEQKKEHDSQNSMYKKNKKNQKQYAAGLALTKSQFPDSLMLFLTNASFSSSARKEIIEFNGAAYVEGQHGGYRVPPGSSPPGGSESGWPPSFLPLSSLSCAVPKRKVSVERQKV